MKFSRSLRTASTLILCTAVAMTAAAAPALAVDSAAGQDASPQASVVSGRVINGSVANHATSGFFLQLSPNFNGSSFLCGATALSQTWAVTAGHCVRRPGDTADTGTGKTYLQTNPTSRNAGVRHYVDKIIVHPGYSPNSSSQHNDLALLHTTSSLEAAPVALNGDAAAPVLGTTENVFGFGETVSGVPSSVATNLQTAAVQDLTGPTGTVCGSYGADYNPAYQLCAGVPAGGTDACQGDSGGPLLATVGGSVKLVGIVSAGTGCALADYPGIYTRVSTYKSWMERYINPKFKYSSLCGKNKKGKQKTVCALKSGKTLKLKITNRTDHKGKFAITAKKSALTVSNRADKIKAGKSLTVSFSSKYRSKKMCVAVNIVATNTSVKRYVIALNGKRNCS